MKKLIRNALVTLPVTFHYLPPYMLYAFRTTEEDCMTIKSENVIAARYFLVTFLVSWAGILGVSFFLGMPTTSAIFESYGPLALIPFLLGPSTVGFIFAGNQYGKRGIRDIVSRLGNWKIPLRYYLFAVLTVPAFIAAWLFLLNFLSGEYLPRYFVQKDKAVFVITGVLTGLIGGGLLEELGWTGFVTPILRKNSSVLKTGLLLGFVWGLWHFLPVFWGSGDENGDISWSQFLPGLFSHYAVLIPFRVIQVWMYEKTKSLITAVIFHSTLTTYALFLFSIDSEGVPVLVYYAGIAVFLWSIVGYLFGKGQLK